MKFGALCGMLFCFLFWFLGQVWNFACNSRTYYESNHLFNFDFVAVDLQNQPSSNDQQDSEGGCMC